MEPGGLEAVYLANRATLIRFLAAHGAGDAAEDLYQELWLRIGARETGPIAAPLAYLYRAANNLMLDRHRAERQAAQRNRDWDEAVAGAPTERVEQPGGERVLIARDQVVRAEAALQAVSPRAATILRRHRVDGVAQREIAAELGVSLSTVESDLRRAYRAILELRREFDEVGHEA